MLAISIYNRLFSQAEHVHIASAHTQIKATGKAKHDQYQEALLIALSHHPRPALLSLLVTIDEVFPPSDFKICRYTLFFSV